MAFNLTKEQQEKANEWISEQDKIFAKLQVESLRKKVANGEYVDESTLEMAEEGIPYFGAIGGGVTYSFTQTGLGVVIKLTHAGTEEELDVSDYDLW